MLSLNLLKAKAVFLIYLTLANYAEASLRHIGLTVPLVDHAEEFEWAEVLTIKEEGTQGCSTADRDVFADVGNKIYQLVTPSGNTLCNISDVHDVVRSTLKEKRGEDVADVDIVAFFVEKIAETGAIRVGLTIGTYGQYALIVAAVAGALFGIYKITESIIRAINSRSIDERGLEDFSPGKSGFEQQTKRASKKIHVSWSESGSTDASAVHQSKQRDMNAIGSCVKKYSKYTQGCCQYVQKSSGGSQYKTAVGLAIPDSSNSGFRCFQDK